MHAFPLRMSCPEIYGKILRMICVLLSPLIFRFLGHWCSSPVTGVLDGIDSLIMICDSGQMRLVTASV